MKNGKAVYVETGAWSKKAIAEAKKVGEVIVAASSKDKNYTYVPDCSDLDIPDDADYVYICENETIHESAARRRRYCRKCRRISSGSGQCQRPSESTASSWENRCRAAFRPSRTCSLKA